MAFDAEAFMNTSIEDALHTERTLFPEGEYAMEIQDIDIKETSNPEWLMGKLSVALDDEEVAKALGRKGSEVKYTFVMFLQLDENGGLKTGENANLVLGQLREALNQNNPSKAWKFTDVIGGHILAQIAHRANKDGNGFSEDLRRIAPLD